MNRVFIGACLAFLVGSPAFAQKKISGSFECKKPDPAYSIDFKEQPGHVLMLQKSHCTASKPMEMGGVKTKEGYSVALGEVTATGVTSHGTHVGTMENGDHFFVSFRDTAKLVDGKPGDAAGAWSFTGGTGKLEGLKGKGTYKVKYNPDNSGTLDVVGTYTLSAAPAKKEGAKKDDVANKEPGKKSE